MKADGACAGRYPEAKNAVDGSVRAPSPEEIVPNDATADLGTPDDGLEVTRDVHVANPHSHLDWD